MSIGKRIYTLDVVKILASICIIFHHYQGEFGVQFSHFNFHNGRFYFGYLVELFFIISGFLPFLPSRRSEQLKISLISSKNVASVFCPLMPSPLWHIAW